MKFYKLLFFITMIMGTLISISAYSWLGMWIGLEINMISIIPLFSNYKNMYSTEAAMKYFLTQALASMFIIMSIILISLNSFIFYNLNQTLILIMNSALFTKMGAAPFHFWFPEVIEGLNWSNSLILLTWQKIAPMILIMYNIKFNFFIITVIIMSMIVSSIMGFNQISLRKIMAFSSINHIGWMISALINSKMIWLIYFIIYSIISINIIFIFNKFKMFYLNQLISMLNSNPILKKFFFFNFLSLGGIPPFLGFFPKWMVIYNLNLNNQFFLSFILIMFTLLTFYFYMRIMFSSFLINYNSPMKNSKINSFYMINFNYIALTSLILFPLIFNFY
nr:NADH dehydrogenase subunit 2 [Clerus sp.]